MKVQARRNIGLQTFFQGFKRWDNRWSKLKIFMHQELLK